MNSLIISQNEKQPRSFGFIYVLGHEFMPGVYKIGMTTRSPQARAAELSGATGVPSPFDVLYYAEVANPALEERRVHTQLAEYRVNECREFFDADLEVILAAIRNEDAAFTAKETLLYSEWGWGVDRIRPSKMMMATTSSEVLQ